MDKSAATICIYKILCDRTDGSHKLTQSEIASILEEKYGLKLERKAISRHLKAIQEAGFKVEGIDSRRGSYLSREFDTGELLFLIESVRSSHSLSKEAADALIEKLTRQSPGDVDENYYVKPDPRTFYCPNAGVLNELAALYLAIKEKKQVNFQYGKVAADQSLGDFRPVTCSPLKLLVREGVPYLVAVTIRSRFLSRKAINKDSAALRFYNVDRISGVTINESAAITADDASLLRMGTTLDELLYYQPYPRSTFVDYPQKTVFLCPKDKYGAVLETFGTRSNCENLRSLPESAIQTASWKIYNLRSHMIRVTTNATAYTMLDFIARHGPYIIIEEPAELREAILRELEEIKKIQNLAARLNAGD